MLYNIVFGDKIGGSTGVGFDQAVLVFSRVVYYRVHTARALSRVKRLWRDKKFSKRGWCYLVERLRGVSYRLRCKYKM